MYVFLVNKMSGNGKGLKAWKRVEPILHSRKIKYQIEFTTNSKEAALFVRKLTTTKFIGSLIVVGGDGTIQSILSEIADSQIQLGIIPAGSGNDYARGLGIPRNVEKALDYIITGSVKNIDIIRVDQQYCITIAGIGLDGEVAHTVNHSKYKRWFNRFKLDGLSYVFGLIAVIIRYKPTTVRIQVDGEDHDFSKVWLIAAANLPYYGGGMKVCPNAQSADGMLDICVVSGISRLKLLFVFPKVFYGGHLTLPAVTMLRGHRIYVSSDKTMVVHGDGEILGQTPTDVRLDKQSLRVMYKQ